MSERPSFTSDIEIQKLTQAYFNARTRLDTKIKKYLSFRYDLPSGKPTRDDPDYDNYMCRNAALTAFIGNVRSLLLIDLAPVQNKDQSIITQIKEINDTLINMSNQPDLDSVDEEHGTTGVRLKTPQEMAKIRSLVERQIDLCEQIVTASNPDLSAVI